MNEEVLAVELASGLMKRRRSIRILLGTPLIYLPILTTVPFVFVGMCLVRLHLRSLGAKNILRYRDFIPAWVSHRYTRRD